MSPGHTKLSTWESSVRVRGARGQGILRLEEREGPPGPLSPPASVGTGPCSSLLLALETAWTTSSGPLPTPDAIKGLDYNYLKD